MGNRKSWCLCEALAQLLLRERSYFLKTEVDAEMREQLRRQVDARNRERNRMAALVTAERVAQQAQRTTAVVANSAASAARQTANRLIGTVKDIKGRSRKT